MKVAVITGATGFIGSHLARRLIERGWKVHGLKRMTSSMELVSDFSQQIQWHNVDETPMNVIWDSVGLADVVFHLATEYGREKQPMSSIASANLLFPLRLLEQAEVHNVPLFVATDTCFPATYPYLRNYTLSKKQFAQWGNVWAQEAGKRFVNLVLQNPFGPGDRAGKFVPWIIDQCLQNVEQIELTSGRQQKDFVFIDDVVGALIILHEQQEQLPDGFSNISCGSGKAIELRQFIEAVHSVSGSSSNLEFGALSDRAGELAFSCADTEALNRLGWTAKFSLIDGIRETIQAVADAQNCGASDLRFTRSAKPKH